MVCTLGEALGSEVLVHFAVDEERSAFIARIDQLTSARVGEPLQLVVDTSRLHFFEPASGLAIYGGGPQPPPPCRAFPRGSSLVLGILRSAPSVRPRLPARR